jgi:hypothetical protein
VTKNMKMAIENAWRVMLDDIHRDIARGTSHAGTAGRIDGFISALNIMGYAIDNGKVVRHE